MHLGDLARYCLSFLFLKVEKEGGKEKAFGGKEIWKQRSSLQQKGVF